MNVMEVWFEGKWKGLFWFEFDKKRCVLSRHGEGHITARQWILHACGLATPFYNSLHSLGPILVDLFLKVLGVKDFTISISYFISYHILCKVFCMIKVLVNLKLWIILNISEEMSHYLVKKIKRSIFWYSSNCCLITSI